MTAQLETASAAYEPIGFRPKAWVAVVNDKALTDDRGGVRRFSTEAAALKAAKAKVTQRVAS